MDPITETYKASVYNIIVPLKHNAEALIYNTLSQSFAVLDRSDCAFLGRERISDLVDEKEIELCDRLILNGYLVPSDVNELELVEKSYAFARNDANSLILTIAPTIYCNFGCDYCFEGADKPKGKMSEEVILATLDYLNRYIDRIKNFHVAWFGGEPLLALDVIEDMSKRFMAVCDAKNVTYGAAIITNGYGLTESVAEKLEQSRVSVVQITLDGSAEFHDARRNLLHSKKRTYERIVTNITSWLTKRKLAVHLRVNVDARNKKNVKELIDDLAERGLGGKSLSMYFAPVEATTRGCSQVGDLTLGKAEYASLERECFAHAYIKKLAVFPFPPRFMGLCGATRQTALVITPTGDLHKCWNTITFEKHRIGNIRNVDAIATDPVNAMWKEWSPFKNESCRACKILPTCAGSCAYKFIHSDDTVGEAAVLPCPSWKFNIKDQLAQLALAKGYINLEDIPEGTMTDPNELCSYEPPKNLAALPIKILDAKRASYAAAGRNLIQIARLKGESPTITTATMSDQ